MPGGVRRNAYLPRREPEPATVKLHHRPAHRLQHRRAAGDVPHRARPAREVGVRPPISDVRQLHRRRPAGVDLKRYLAVERAVLVVVAGDDDAPHLAANLRNYIAGFSPNMREVLEKFDFDNTISKLDEADLLFQKLERFKDLDLHPDKVDNPTMGMIFEELLRKLNVPIENGLVLPQSGHGWRNGAPAVSSRRSAVSRRWRGVVGRL